MSAPQWLRLGVNTALLVVMKTCLNWYQRLDPALNNVGKNLPAASSLTRAAIDPEDGTVAGSSKSMGDQASSDSESSRENMDDSNMDTASRDCVLCSDTDKVAIQTTHKKYQRRVQAYCRLSNGNLWTEAQLKKDWQRSSGHVGT